MAVHKYSICDLENLAIDISNKINPPYSILLSGDVGSGKTTFSQFFIKNLLIDKEQSVSSPTFNIVQIYETIKGPLWHVDLYRIKYQEEIYDLGLLEAMNECICLIEWPDLLEPYIKSNSRLTRIQL